MWGGLTSTKTFQNPHQKKTKNKKTNTHMKNTNKLVVKNAFFDLTENFLKLPTLEKHYKIGISANLQTPNFGPTACQHTFCQNFAYFSVFCSW